MKVSVLITIILISLFLMSCEPALQDTSNATNDTQSGCAPHWECVDEDYQHYQKEDCTWQKPEKCERGCFNNTCRSAEICTVGFKCIDENRRGYQAEDCSFPTKIDCEWGCADGKCNEMPENATASTTNTTNTTASSGISYIAENAEENETVPEGPRQTLQIGAEQEFQAGGSTHIIKIYNIEVDRVIIKVDDEKSDWIAEGGSFTYANLDTTITIKSILFQTYGKKEIEYILS